MEIELENKRKEEAERAERDRKDDEFNRRQEEADRKLEANLKELEDKMAKINLDIERKVEDAESGGSWLMFFFILILAGIAVIFGYAKKNGCSYADAVKAIHGNVRGWLFKLTKVKKR